MPTQHLFTDRTVLVTGGSRGIGRGISQYFLQAGAKVVVCARNKPVDLPVANGNAALFYKADVRNAESTQELINFAVEQTGQLDVLINNAGGSPEVAAAEASPRFISAVIATNLVAPAILSQQAYKAICDTATTGSIINITSVSAARPSPGTAAYGAAKAGLVNLTRSLAQEWAPKVRVNAIIAGLAKTESALDHYGGEEGIARIEQYIPMQRMALPDDIAKACFYLASDSANYVSGAALEVHGGGEPPLFLSLQHGD